MIDTAGQEARVGAGQERRWVVTKSRLLTWEWFILLFWGLPALAADLPAGSALPLRVASLAPTLLAPLPDVEKPSALDLHPGDPEPYAPRLITDPWGSLHERVDRKSVV